MIIVCPLCQTRYLVPASLFATGGRHVRCARCSHGWRAELPKEIEVVAPPPPADELDYPAAEPQPVPAGSSLPVPAPARIHLGTTIAGSTGIVLLLAASIWLLANRADMIGGWPGLARYYDAIGLHLPTTGEGLVFEGVHSELLYDGGIIKLSLAGKIKNNTEKTQLIPNIIATALGSDGNAMQSWQIDAPTARLAAAGEAPFQSVINAPRGSITTINLNFIGPKHDDGE